MDAKRMGRKPKQPEDRQTASLVIKMKPADRELIDSVGGSAPSAWAREILLSVARRILKKRGEK